MTSFQPTHEQQRVLDATTNLVVTACPGSGKTAVVAEKVRLALPQLLDHQGIIAISYTNKASNELKERCRKSGVDLKRSFFGTIDKFSISEVVLPFIGHTYNFNSGKFLLKKFASAVSQLNAPFTDDDRDRLMSATEYADVKDLIEFFLNLGYVLLEAVPILAINVLDGSTSCQRYLKARYTSVFIDEYQDAGVLQHRLFLKLTALGLCGIAVGDSNQSIFKFAKRDPVHLISLTHSDSGFTHIPLTINHRSHPSIINYAERLLNPSFSLLPSASVEMFQFTVPGQLSAVGPWIDKVLDKLKEHFRVKRNSDIGVLSLTSNRAFEVIGNMKTPCKFVADGFVFETDHVSVPVLLSLLCYRFDTRRTIQSVLDEAFADTSAPGILKKRRSAISLCRTCSDADLLTSLILAAELIVEEAIPAQTQAEIQALLSQPDQIQSFIPPLDDEIQAMTLHRSKGLEFDVVIHLDLVDWVFPKKRFDAATGVVSHQDYQQCLNLHYVGITRAKKGCILVTNSKRLNRNNNEINAQPSEFLGLQSISGLFRQKTVV